MPNARRRIGLFRAKRLVVARNRQQTHTIDRTSTWSTGTSKHGTDTGYGTSTWYPRYGRPLYPSTVHGYCTRYILLDRCTPVPSTSTEYCTVFVPYSQAT